MYISIYSKLLEWSPSIRCMRVGTSPFNMGRIITTLLIIFAGITSSYAYDFEVDNLWFYLPQTGSSLTLAGGENRSGDLYIPESVSYRNRIFEIGHIKESAFQGCSFYKVSIPGTIKYISNASFRNAGINLLNLSEGNVRIGVSAFEDSHITDLSIPNSIDRIEDVAFRGSKSLKNITLGNGLKYIHWGAFQNCEVIENIVCYADDPPEVYVSEIDNYNKPVFDNIVYQFATLKVPSLSIGKYKTSPIWGLFHTIEPISEESLSQFEQLSIEWDMLENKCKQIEPDIYRLSSGSSSTFYAYNITESTDKNGKVKTKRGSNCEPLGEWSNGHYNNRNIALGAHKDGNVTKRLMLHGYIKLTDSSDYEEFFTIPLELPYSEQIVFDGVTSSDKKFTMQIQREFGARSEIMPINDAGGRTHLISALPDDANIKVTYIDNDGVEYKFLIALKNIPPCYIPK